MRGHHSLIGLEPVSYSSNIMLSAGLLKHELLQYSIGWLDQCHWISMLWYREDGYLMLSALCQVVVNHL